MTEQDIPGDVCEGTSDTFASVWVKVEMDDDMEEETDALEVTQTEEPQKPQKSKRKYNRTILQCEQCSYTTIHKNCLKMHVLDHMNSKPHICNLCTYSTKYPTSLQRHMFIKHKESTDDVKTLFYCDSCDYSTYFKWNLNSHKRRHTTDKQFQCEHCSYSTAYRHNFIKHSRVHNKVTREYTCDKCPFVTKFAGHIQRHLSQIHNEVSDKACACDVCDFSTMVRWRLNIHKQRSRQENPLKCGICGFQTFYMCENKKHKKTHFNDMLLKVGVVNGSNGVSDKPIDVDSEQPDRMTGVPKPGVEHTHGILNGVTGNEGRLNDLEDVTQREDLTEQDVFKTDTMNSYHMVDRVNENKGQINNAIEHKYNDTDGMAEDIFKAGLTQMYDMVNKVTENRTIIDPSYYKECVNDRITEGDTYNNFNEQHTNLTTNPNLTTKTPKLKKLKNYIVDPNCESRKTIQVLESDNVERPFQCVKCAYTSKFKAAVIRHYQRHHTSENRPYKCCNCDFSTKTKDQISLHNKRSQSEGTLICNICNFTTNFKCTYVMHQKVHYAHKCTKCDYSCRNKYDIQKHFSTVHMGEGMKCRFCDYRSGRRESLLCHEAIHTGHKPFKCELCDYQSVRKSLLEVHFRRCHTDVIVAEGKVQESKQTE
ncbi:zinc finger protein Xfin [Manduca sexta]|uniref:zinc finger protein Xfin n=1 Tax=Manduca sexta TaxID=7130 RepID=UPI00188E6127|nr:zinc finger protein Xfin [Manduca sexta]XP_037300150.1 zinc finger protein Xfin [Manduca sexta]